MKTSYFLSQRLGFCNAQADFIEKNGLDEFLKQSFAYQTNAQQLDFIADAPKTRAELREIRQMGEAEKKKLAVDEIARTLQLARWWTQQMYENPFPLREKMVLFWHNHFVSSFQKIKLTYPLFVQNQLFRQHAFGNFKILTKAILYDNAMLMYLDNTQNRVGKLNENLSRELLELFTLGVGNYTENDIKAGARALAGLMVSDDGGRYLPRLEDNGQKTYLGKTGNLKADDLVEQIFLHPNMGYRISEKLIKFFVTDTPPSVMVEEYAVFLKKSNFEIKPFLQKLFRDERFLKSQGEKIKDPLTFLLTCLHEFETDTPTRRQLLLYGRAQGMELFNPPNVKGWDGGKAWLSSQKLLQRVSLVNLLCKGKLLDDVFGLKRREMRASQAPQTLPTEQPDDEPSQKMPSVKWQKQNNNKLIIKDLTNRIIFKVSQDMQQDAENILKYDFDPTAKDAQAAVTRLVEYLMKTPEFQIY